MYSDCSLKCIFPLLLCDIIKIIQNEPDDVEKGKLAERKIENCKKSRNRETEKNSIQNLL